MDKIQSASLTTTSQLWPVLKNLVYPMTLRRRRATDSISQVSRHLETGRRGFHNSLNLSKKASLVNPPTHKVVVKQPVVEPKEKTLDEMMLSSEEGVNRSSVFRRDAQGTIRKQANCQAHNVSIHSPKDSICELCKPTKTTRAASRNRPEARGYRVHHPPTVGEVKTLKLSVERTSLVCSIVGQSWCMTLILIGFQRSPTKKTAQETMKSLQKFLPSDQKPGVVHTHSSMEFTRL